MDIGKLSDDLEILIHYSDEPTVALRGEIDYNSMERIRQAISLLVGRGNGLINIDLRGLEFMDSTGVSALIEAANAIAPSGGSLKLVTASAQLAKILSKCGVSGLFCCEQVDIAHALSLCPAKPDSRDAIEFELPSQPEMLSHIRKLAAEYACSMPFTDEDIEDIKLAVGEAATNAMRHGKSSDWHRIRIRMERQPDALRICIADKGNGFDPDLVCCPDIGNLCEGGRGIMFMKALMDEVKFHCNEPGTCVELVKRFRVS